MRLGETRTRTRITRKECRLAAFFGDGFDAGQAAFLIATEHGDFCTRRAEAFSQRATQHSGGANNDRHFAIEGK